jgi:hypothetical protein
MIAGNRSDDDQIGEAAQTLCQRRQSPHVVDQVTTQEHGVGFEPNRQRDQFRAHISGPPMSQVQVAGVQESHGPGQAQRHFFMANVDWTRVAEVESPESH